MFLHCGHETIAIASPPQINLQIQIPASQTVTALESQWDSQDTPGPNAGRKSATGLARI